MSDDISALMAEGHLAYLASPYSAPLPYIQSLRYSHAVEVAAELISRKILVFSPIVHSHPIAKCKPALGTDHLDWKLFNTVMMYRCDSLIVCRMDGWENSKGIAHEIKWFEFHGKPIYDLHPPTLLITKRDLCGND